MLEAIIKRYAGGKKSDMANILGITPQGISTWLKRGMFDVDLIFAKCEGINPRWLLSGEGPMIVNQIKEYNNESRVDIACEQHQPYSTGKNDNSILLDMLHKNELMIQELNRYIGKLESQVEVLEKKTKDVDVGDVGCADTV